MPAFIMRFRVPEALTDRDAQSCVYWTKDGLCSLVSTAGRRLELRLGPRLGALGPVPQANIDLVRLAVLVYVADRSVLRRVPGSNWSRRDMRLEVPVHEPDHWDAVRGRLEQMLRFLSGDTWALSFRASQAPREQVAEFGSAGARRVVLLSGGADSAVGALVSRHDLASSAQALVSHVGATTLSPIQQGLAADIERLVGGGTQFHQQIHLSRRRRQPSGFEFANEYSTRTRSLLFLALGLAVASVERVPLWIPENGFASLNPPLGAEQRGSLSTRTTHPNFLEQLASIATTAGAHAIIENPFMDVTKGEMFRRVAELVGAERASNLLSSTHSCAHTGHRSLGLPVRLHCGVCFGCLLRRASFLAAKVRDQTDYLHERNDERLRQYLRDKSIEGVLRAFLVRGLRPADVTALSLPASYPASKAYELCARGVAELELLFR